MKIKLQLTRQDNTATFEQLFDEYSEIMSKLSEIGSLFDFYTISINNKTILNKKPIKGALDAFSSAFSN